jgi:hypothetical protein
MVTYLPSELWTSAETAKYLGFKQNRLILLAGKGLVPGSYKAGPGLHADWRFDADKIRTYKLMCDERAEKVAGMLNIHEAASFLKYNKEAVRRLTRLGRIKAIKDGDGPKAEWRFTKTDLVQFLVTRTKSDNKGEEANA